MIIKIDVPDTTEAISVSAIYRTSYSANVAMTSRCFTIKDGKAEDETGSNKVVQGVKDNERKAD
jgi:lipocalin